LSGNVEEEKWRKSPNSLLAAEMPRGGRGEQPVPDPSASHAPGRSGFRRPRHVARGARRLTQEGIVFILAVAIFCGLSVGLPGFFSGENIVSLVRSVAVLGTLSLGMGLVVIGRGVDLTMIANMVISVGLAIALSQIGVPLAAAFATGLAFVVFTGALTGYLVAYAEIPAIFATLAMGAVIYGIGHSYFFTIDNLNAPNDAKWFAVLGTGRVLGLPVPIFIFAGLALALHLLLARTRFGRFVHYIGDNPQAARITGMPLRPLTVALYIISGVIAFIGGMVVTASTHTLDARLYGSTMIYDVLLVVVLGGIGLSGGQGSVRNVIVGTIFVGLMLNGMTIMDVPYIPQNLIKSLILLAALAVDSLVNPRDEQTAQQGDI
jgi:ribose transport system permease protein